MVSKGVISMATKSIYKSIHLKNRALCRGLVNALESAQNKKSKEVVMTKKVREVKGDELKKLFGDD